MSDEPTPEGQAPTPAPATDDGAADEAAPIEPTTDEPTTDEPATPEPVAAGAKAPPPRSIARDVALVAVVFVAVFILLGGLLWLAVPPGDRGGHDALTDIDPAFGG